MEGWQAKPDGVVGLRMRIIMAGERSQPSNHPALAGTPPQEGNGGMSGLEPDCGDRIWPPLMLSAEFAEALKYERSRRIEVLLMPTNCARKL